MRTKLHRNVIIAFILSIGLTISIASFHYINTAKLDSNKQLIEQAILETNHKFNKELKKISLAATSLQVLFEASDTITRQVFDDFTSPFIKNLPGMRALEWAPQVLNQDRAAYCLLMEADGFKEYAIKEPNSSNDKLITAQTKPYYFPVQFIAPIQLTPYAIGYDLAANADRLDCIEKSKALNSIVVSPPLDLIQNTDGSRSFLVVKYIKKSPNFIGVILGVYNMADFIQTILASELKLLDILVYDKSSNYAPIYSSIHQHLDAAVFSPHLTSNFFESKLHNRTWTVCYAPKPIMIQYPHMPLAYACLILGVFIVLLLVIMVYIYSNSKLYLEQKIEARTQDLNQANQEQAVLLKEIHHRVKNNLQVITSLLSLQSSNIDNPQIKEIFSVSQHRINTMAILHEELYQSENLSKIGYAQYLRKLVEYLIKSISLVDCQIDLEIEVPHNLKLNIDTAIPLGLIINEITTNALKYGICPQKKGKIYIRIVPQNYPFFLLQIGDNGQGFPQNITHKTTKSLGLKLIYQLTRQLSGQLQRKPEGSGTHYEITFQEVA